MTECPQCGTANQDDAKNCCTCRINLYWAFQHYQELAELRAQNQLPPAPTSPAFLLATSRQADTGPTAPWLHNIIKKFGFKNAGKKISTL